MTPLRSVQAPATEPELLTEKQAAAFLCMSVRWLQNTRLARYVGPRPKFVKVGSMAVRYDKVELKRYLLERKIATERAS